MKFEFTEKQLLEMFRLQDELNKKVNPDWLTAGYPWHRAAYMEAAELIESIGWKWWKEQKPDLENIKMEIVDIWHFGLSQALGEFLGYRDRATTFAASEISEQNRYEVDLADSGMYQVEQFIADTALGIINLGQLASISLEFGMTSNEVYELYLVKNVLNGFRQNRGYKQGTYTKEWFGVEDNVYAVKAAKDLSALGKLDSDSLYDALSFAYDRVEHSV